MKRTAISATIVSIILAACGGGGGGGDNGTSAAAAPAAPTVNEAQGIYTGKDSSNDQIVGAILDSGAYYFVYVNSSTRVIGLVQGTSTASGGIFKSTDAKNYYIGQNAVLNETVSANYTAKSNISGTISPTTGGASTTFSGTYSSIYDQAPSLSSIAGTYTGAGGSVRGGESVTVTLGADGSINGRGPSGCTFSGTASSHSGKNIYDATITFGGTNCLYPGRSLTGIVTVASNQLIAAAPLADRSDAFILVGSK